MRLTLGATLLMFSATALLIAWNEQFVFRNEGRLIVTRDREDPAAAVFSWQSAVEVPMARRFEEAFSKWGDKTDRIIIDLNSPGGALREGEAVIRQIKSWKRTHIVDTRVRGRRACYSMCVPIFLQGDKRAAGPRARFMFHQPMAYDFFTGEQIDQPAFEKERAAQRFYERYFINSPMDSEWGEALTAAWREGDVWRTGQELRDEGSNIVTDLE